MPFKKKINPDELLPRVQLSFTLQNGAKKRLLDHCNANMINKSQLIEKLIIDYFNDIDFVGMEKRD